MRVLAATEHELDFWVRHVKVGVRLTYATAVVSWAYFALTWGQPNRPAMTVLVAATAIDEHGRRASAAAAHPL